MAKSDHDKLLERALTQARSELADLREVERLLLATQQKLSAVEVTQLASGGGASASGGAGATTTISAKGLGWLATTALFAGAFGAWIHYSEPAPRLLAPSSSSAEAAFDQAPSLSMRFVSLPAAVPASPGKGAAQRESVDDVPVEPMTGDLGVAKDLPPAGVSELGLIEQADAALDSAPRKALSVLRLHERYFPSGVLAQERELMAIKALLDVGESPEAHRRAERFRASFPHSPHLRRIEWLLKKNASRADKTKSVPLPTEEIDESEGEQP